MAPRRTPRRTHCPIAFSLDLFGDRWTLLIVRDLLLKRRSTWVEFLASGEGIASNILADRLARLSGTGVLVAIRDPEDRRGKIYRLTEKGLDLAPVLVEMILWGAKHDPRTAADLAFVRRARSDREALLREIRAAAEGQTPRRR